MSLFIKRFQEIVRNDFDKTAIVDNNGRRRITYKTLDKMSDSIAAYLKNIGYVHGDVVMIAGSRRAEYIAAELAAFKIGCVSVPVLDSYPQERINMIKEDCGAKAILTDEILDKAVNSDHNIIFDGSDMSEEDMALIIYTSGSTGKPKGVVHSAGSVYASVQRNTDCTGIDGTTRYLHTFPFTFAAAPAFIFSCLCAGAETVLLPRECCGDIRCIEDWIVDKEINCAFISPQLLYNFKNRSKSLRTVLTDSDKVSGVCGDGYRLLNLYGLSETIFSICRYEERDYYLLTDSQMGIYFECCEKPESTIYHIPYLYKADRILDADKLAVAIQKAIDNHPIMNIRIENRNGNPVMVKTDRKCNVQVVNIQEDEIHEYANAFVKPFDFEKDVLYRAAVLRTENHLYFILDFHHIISDGTSIAVILDDIKKIYEGQAPKSESLTLFHISVDEEKKTETDAYKKSMDFFADKLSGIEVDSMITPDGEFGEKQPDNRSGILMRTLISDKSCETVTDFLRKNSVNEVSFFMSAFAYTLAVFSGQSEALFCTVSNGRHDIRLKNTAGMLVHTLPIYVKIDENLTSSEYIAGVQNDFAETISNDLCSFGELANKFGINSDIMFVYQSDMLNGVTIEHAVFEAIHIPTEPQANITVMIFKKKESYEIRVEYRTDLYSQKLIEVFAETMDCVLNGMLNHKVLRTMELISENQKSTLDTFNHTEDDYDSSKSVVDLLREQMIRVPDKTAVVYKDKKITYRELDDITERTGAYLHSLGIGREDVVSVLIPRNEYMPIASIGVLKSGAAYQPLDPTYPMDRLAFMMQDADAKLLIADEALLSLVPEYKGKVLLTKDIPSLPKADLVLPGPKPEDLFIMLYTSGSTGVPKGCQLEHRNLVAYCHMHHKAFEMTENSRAASYASYGFDANMLDMYSALTIGAAVYIIDDEIRFDLPNLNRYFEENGITQAFMTTQVARQFAVSQDNHSLECLIGGGEKLVSFKPLLNYKMYNIYGPTENTIFINYFHVDQEYEDIPIGKTIKNMKEYVLDPYGRRMPIGAPGELCSAGMQVARGYLNRPEQTEKIFTENPFTNEYPYNRIYHTGDIVRYLPDGNIQFIGRRDAQVKIRGFRIELTEVEKAIREYPLIKDATVVAKDAPSGEKFIAAYIVSDEPVDMEKLNDFIRETKPPYMVPAVTMQIDKIPLNQNMKVDKKKLPEPQMKIEHIVMPQNEVQQKIYDCIAEIVGHTAFGIDTDIFLAGLSSIAVIKLGVELYHEFGISIKNKDFKANNTVLKLEKFFAGAEEDTAYEKRAVYPITQTQQGIFVECMAKDNTTVYNIPLLLKLNDGIDMMRLKNALEQTVAAHPYIKTKMFIDENGTVLQRRNDDDEYFVEVLNDFDQDTLVQPFDVLGERLFRIRLYETSEGKYLFIDIHHIISDGTSMNIFLNDVSRAYTGEKLTEEAFSGYEAALDEQKAKASPAWEEAKNYYDSIFNDCDADCLPLRNKYDKEPGMAECKLEVKTDIKALYDFCDKHEITMNALFTAAFGYIVGTYAGRKDAVFTTVYNGRNDARLENTISMFVKTLPFYCDINGEKTVIEYLKDTKEQLMASMANDIYSFADISSSYGIKSDILFAYQGDYFDFDHVGGYPCESITLELNAARALVAAEVFLGKDRIKFSIEYRSDMYDDAFISGLLESFANTVSEMTKKAYLKDISILSEDAASILDRFNNTEYDYDSSKSVVDLLREQMIRVPDKTAVVYKDKKITYGELDDITERIGAYVHSLGIGREDVVSILIPRNEYMPIASIGVLKSGAAYQPLDSTYPIDRLAFMMKDADAKLLIADEKMLALVPEYNGKVLLTKDIPSLPKTDLVLPGPKPEDLFIMLYTSGSTGVPKGCQLEHRNLAAYCRMHCKTVNLTESSRATAYASYGFDANMQELYPTLTIGATLYIIDDEIRFNLPILNQYFEENHITQAFMTTQVARQFAISQVNHCLECLVTGGEKLVSLNPPTNYKMYNLYGPTENTVFINYFHVDKEYEDIPIGKAVVNVKEYVLDSYGRRMPIGAPGELCSAGMQVARGYLNRPEQTEKAFTKNPFTSEYPYDRIYHTGDIVRYLPDGNVQFIGRRDAQVKIRGFRVELTEVEKAIREYPPIKDATVVAKDAPSGGKFIAAYIVSDEPVDIEKLNDFIRETKPPYMVPAVTMQIDKIPLNQNMKVDKKKLPEPLFTTTGEYVEPANDTEREFCEIFQTVLGIERVGATDNFFEIGGTSLVVIKAIVAAANAGYEISYNDVFSHSSPRELAIILTDKGKNDEPLDDKIVTDYDYSIFNELLAGNTLEAYKNGEKQELGDVLLTGATGFLGIHVLHELLSSHDGKIYCLMRAGKHGDAVKRLESMLFYYFENSCKDLIGKKLFIISGDITDRKSFEQLADIKINMVLNCAANVKHFSNGTDIEDVNYGGILNIIDYCNASGAALLQISTMSVNGFSLGKPTDKVFDEKTLYFGQDLDNKYIHSKFLAERAVLENIVKNNLNARIIRVGNLSSRDSDGEFQMNYRTNSSMGRLNAFALIGKYPYEIIETTMEFSPIDFVAKSIITLAHAPKECCIFHAYNAHEVMMGDIFRQMNDLGICVTPCETAEFEEKFEETKKDFQKAKVLSSMVAYEDMGHGQTAYPVSISNEYTMQVLYRNNIFSPFTTWDYMNKFITVLKDLGFFSVDYLN